MSNYENSLREDTVRLQKCVKDQLDISFRTMSTRGITEGDTKGSVSPICIEYPFSPLTLLKVLRC